MTATHTSKTTIASVTPGERALTVEWKDGTSSVFHYMWLRDNCPLLLDPLSEQRRISPMDIPEDIHPTSATLNADDQLEIVWAHDGHLSRFDPQWLRRYCYSNGKIQTQQRSLWDAAIGAALPVFDYNEVFTDDKALHQWLSLYRDYGFARLRNVPVKPKTVLEVVRKLSYLWNVSDKNVGHSGVFEIKGSGRTDRIAYTNQALPSHTDDAYYDPVPPVQVLHCIANDADGGDSTLADSFKIAAVLRRSEPEKFRLLCTLPVQFRYHSPEEDIIYNGPFIRINVSGKLQQIRFSNQSIQPFRLSADVMEAYYDAYRTFCRMTASDEFRFRFRLRPGDLYMIDNWRILHGRMAFSDKGERYLESCFMGSDGLYSRLRLLLP